MDFLEFFNLKEDPFKLTPDTFYYYPSENHNELLSSLNYVIEQKEGFYLATGGPGTGKTTILKMFLQAWKDKALIALVLTPRLSPAEFLSTIMEDFKVEVKGANKNDTIKAFRDFLIDSASRNEKVIIIVDEAQNLPWETLEELRLLSNLETEKEKLLQIILMGQPQLAEMLKTEKLEQLNQRITVKCFLKPLSMAGTSEYINYRIIKGGKGTVFFNNNTHKHIYGFSKGIPRLINFVSSRAMMTAFLDSSKVVTKKHIVDTIKHISDGNMTIEKNRLGTIKYVALFVIILSALASIVYTKYYPLKVGMSPTAETKTSGDLAEQKKDAGKKQNGINDTESDAKQKKQPKKEIKDLEAETNDPIDLIEQKKDVIEEQSPEIIEEPDSEKIELDKETTEPDNEINDTESNAKQKKQPKKEIKDLEAETDDPIDLAEQKKDVIEEQSPEVIEEPDSEKIELDKETTEPDIEKTDSSKLSRGGVIFSFSKKENIKEKTTLQEPDKSINAILTVKSANVRLEPSSKSRILYWIGDDSDFAVLESTFNSAGEKWYKVINLNGTTGWVAGSLIMELE